MKKSILSIVILSLVGVFVNAQTFVSTTPENKNTVLEEFTGIHCGYCPDGHKRAQELKDANPDDVVLVNIHVGGYAVPSTGEPDFRTPYGTAIDAQADVSGYPAGTINRTDYTSQGWDMDGGTAMSRGNWSSASALILAEASYVNVAAQASIDLSTRVLTVDVEAYYTANGAASNNVNVALLQNNIPGPQSGGSTWNPSQILPNGDYNHGHMLRHLLTGQWGDINTSTTSGDLYTNTFTYTIPNDLNGVVYDLFNLEVVVFIAEGQQVIVTGSDASMSFIVPPGYSLVDVEAATNMALPASYCDGDITPEITVTNNGTSTIDTYEVSYSLDGATPVTQAGTNLAASASSTISFPQITLNNGSHNIAYNVNTDGTMDIDSIPANNDVNSETINTVSPTPFSISHGEGFESYSPGSEAVNNVVLLNPNGESTYVVDNTVSQSVTWPLGAFGNSDQSWRMRFYTWAQGSEATLVFENIDLSTWGGANGTSSDLFFSYSYAQYSAENDRLEVLVSKDCGATWIPVFDEQGTGLATAPAVSTGHFYPGINQWAKVNVDMSYYDGESSIMIAFKGTSDFGNNLYLDDIALWNYSTIEETASASFQVRTYPNPINDLGPLELTLVNKADVQVSVYDMLGQMIIPVNSGVLAAGEHHFDIVTEGLENGIYLVKVEVDGQVQSSNIIISN